VVDAMSVLDNLELRCRTHHIAAHRRLDREQRTGGRGRAAVVSRPGG